LKGNWVKVTVDSISGYFIDHYLLDLNPEIVTYEGHFDFLFKVISIDTTWINPEKENGNEPDFCIIAYHDPKITSSHCFGGKRHGERQDLPECIESGVRSYDCYSYCGCLQLGKQPILEELSILDF